MYKENAQKLADILTSLIAGTKLQAVYNYDVKQTDVYPFAMVRVKDGESDFFDTSENQMISSYMISIVNENKTVATSEVVMRELVDEVLLELHKKENLTLGGTVNMIIPRNIVWGLSETNESVRICDITIEVNENI
jgi:hypothetical protein